MNNVCDICSDILDTNLAKLNCGHIFHSGCIDNWLKRTLECPMCRNIIT